MLKTTVAPNKTSFFVSNVPINKPRSSFIVAAEVYILFWAITLLIPPHHSTSGYFAALEDKHLRLNTTASPKIIFIGGSNLAFGLDSYSIENKFHTPVINMGMCVLFGLRYILEEVKDSIKSGDLVVITPEYELQSNPYGTPFLLRTMETYPTAFRFILRAYSNSPQSFFNLLSLIRSYPRLKWNIFYRTIKPYFEGGNLGLNLWKKRDVSSQTKSPARFCFNKEGDYLGHLAKPNSDFTLSRDLVGTMSPEAADLINNFWDFAKHNKADVVLIPPPVPREDLAPSRCSSLNLRSWPGQSLKVPVLAPPDRYAFASTLFYEAPYHLNSNGRALRTKLICEDLERYFAKKGGKH